MIVLDVVLNEKEENRPHLWVGGSCGNVMAILAFFGWLSYPIAYIGKDRASRIILNDMKKWGVRTDFIFGSKEISTPIVVEKIRNGNNGITHVFEFKCPFCGSLLPRNRAIPREIAEELRESIPPAQVFYFDRVSRATLALASIEKSKGALIVFEPHKVNDGRLFKESLEVAHVVKYSAEKVKDIEVRIDAPLEIQTIGAKGLRYRFKKNEWKMIEGVRLSHLADSAGAGDWCTAGLIHFLGQGGFEEFSQIKEDEIEVALRFAQCLAALKCVYEGPRGIMYNISKRQLASMLDSLYIEKDIEKHEKKTEMPDEPFLQRHLCPSCQRVMSQPHRSRQD